MNYSEINALTRNITRCLTALEEDDRIIELTEMRNFADACIKSINEAKTAGKVVHA
jgi:hypothetical protein